MKKLNDPKFATFKNLVISLLIITAGGWLIINYYYWTDTPQNNIYEFEATIDSNPEFTGKAQCFTFDILESEYTLSYNRQRIPSTIRKNLDIKLQKGDKVIVGLTKEDYVNNVIHNYSRSWYSGQHIDAIQLSTKDYKITDMETFRAYELRERKIGLGLGVYTICWVLIAFLLRFSVISMGKKNTLILIGTYLLLTFILYQVIK
jgi:hypothetical protein